MRVGRWLRWICLVLLATAALAFARAETTSQAGQHTDPLNLDPEVRQGYERFYNLDFDGALAIFNKVAQQHAQDPMAWNYVLVTTIFRELYHQDLLDTTYYAHDSFLSNKRDVRVPQATREQIENLTNKVIGMCDAATEEQPG